MSKLPETLDELNVKLLKLLSGETIIAYMHDLDSEYEIGMEEPMLVTIDESHHYTLVPWVPFSNGEVHIINNVNIILESSVDNSMKAYYMKLVLDQIAPDETEIANPDSKTLH